MIGAVDAFKSGLIRCAGNLLVLRDGRLGFIDFGIVGKISPVTFQALEAFLMSTMTADYNTMARALVTMGVTQEAVVIEVSHMQHYTCQHRRDYRGTCP